MRHVRPLLALAAALAFAGCGAEASKPPDLLRSAAPTRAAKTNYPAAGMKFERPANWQLRPREAPGVFTIASGSAVVTGWAYRRREPLPAVGVQLVQARDRLKREAKRRDSTWRATSAKTRRLRGSAAIDLRGRQRIGGRELRIRSVHVFKGRSEYVIEGIAPPADFALLDARVLRPMLRSLRVTGRVKKQPAGRTR